MNGRLGLCAVTFAAAIALAAGGDGIIGPGDLDPSFGEGGKAFIGDTYFVLGGASVSQPDGKIVVTGAVDPTGSVNRDIIVGLPP